MKKLIALLEKAAGPSRELDGALWLALEADTAMKQCWGVRGMKYAGHVHTKAEKAASIKRMSEYASPIFTGSLDAAIGLVERMLPGWAWWIERIDGIKNREHLFIADLWIPSIRTQGLKVERVRAGSDANAAVAVLIALLRALQLAER